MIASRQALVRRGAGAIAQMTTLHKVLSQLPADYSNVESDDMNVALR